MSLEHQLEALLFSSGKAMDEEHLAVLTEVSRQKVKNALKKLQNAYADRETALRIFNEGSLWKMHIIDEHVALVRKIVSDTELSRACLETLAIVAYGSPILQSEVVEKRGGNAYEHVKELVELNFVTKEKEGRSYKLKVTDKFYEYFDVEGEDDIRRVFKNIKQPPKEQQKKLGGLDVVAVPAAEKKKGKVVGDLEVVDVSEESLQKPTVAPAETTEEDEGEEKNAEDVLSPAHTIERNREEEDDFLRKIESQIESISRKNDVLDKDESFKPMAQPEGEGEVAPIDGEEDAEMSSEEEGESEEDEKE